MTPQNPRMPVEDLMTLLLSMQAELQTAVEAARKRGFERLTDLLSQALDQVNADIAAVTAPPEETPPEH